MNNEYNILNEYYINNIYNIIRIYNYYTERKFVLQLS